MQGVGQRWKKGARHPCCWRPWRGCWPPFTSEGPRRLSSLTGASTRGRRGSWAFPSHGQGRAGGRRLELHRRHGGGLLLLRGLPEEDSRGVEHRGQREALEGRDARPWPSSERWGPGRRVPWEGRSRAPCWPSWEPGRKKTAWGGREGLLAARENRGVGMKNSQVQGERDPYL